MKKQILMACSLSLAAILLSSCSTKEQAKNDDKLSIVTTIFPQYDFTKQIVQDNAEVTMLLKPGAESHSYEPTPQDIKKIQNADLFIYTGSENDVWVDDILDSMKDKKPQTLKLLDCVPTVTEEVVEGMEHEHEHEHEEIHEDDITERPLSDFEGDFQSVLPYFEDGSLDSYIDEQAKENEKTFDETKQEFIQKRQTDYKNISIHENTVTFQTDSDKIVATYSPLSYKVVKDDDGDITSVWYAYTLDAKSENAPKNLIFNDHHINDEHEEEVPHFHIRYGNDSVDELVENNDWTPTYYAASASADDILHALTEHEHEEEIDEHVWTSPINAMKIVEKITELVSEKDSENADTYKKNCDSYIEQLKELDASFRDVVNHAKRKTIVFGDRFPFRYFADEYGLKYYAAFTGCSTETEASAATIAFLTDKVKEEQIPVVFHIELSNEKIADTICEATGAKKMVMYACHNVSKEQMENGATYLSMMQDNVKALQEALN